jgi:hypothetical protein
MEKQIIIVPGHYQTISSENSDKPEIIRILGQDPARENNWITQDGKSIPSYIIENDYFPLFTSPVKPTNKKPKINIFAGISSVDKVEDIEDTEDIELSTNETSLESINEPVKTTHKLFVEDTSKKEKPTPPIDISIINRISIDRLNQETEKKYGITKYVKPIINLKIPIQFDYDILKLQTTIELLNLDEDTIVNYLVDSMSLNVRPLIKSEIKRILRETGSQQNKDSAEAITEAITEAIPEAIPEVIPEAIPEAIPEKIDLASELIDLRKLVEKFKQ